MSIFDENFGGNFVAAAGKPSTFFENIAQGYEQQYRVDSSYSLEFEIQQRWRDTTRRYEELTGEAPSFSILPRELNAYTRAVLGEDPSVFQRRPFSEKVSPTLQRDIDAFTQYNNKIKALGREDLPAFEQVLEEVFEMQAEVERQSGLLAETGGLSGIVGQFIGAIGGSFTEREPLSFAGIGLGRTVAQRVLFEAAQSGGLVGAAEFGAVQPNRELAGLPERDPYFDVAVAAAAGGAFQGAGELVSRLLRGRRARTETPPSTEELREALASDTGPDVRAAQHLLDKDDLIARSNPYGEGRAGLRRFTAELEEVEALFRGQTDTAISRILPPIPYDQLKKNADIQLVREQAPDIYEPLARAQQELELINAQIVDLEDSLNGQTLPQAVGQIDEVSGRRLEELAARLDTVEEGSPEAAGITLEAEAIINRLGGEEAVARQIENNEIAPRQELKTLRNSRRAANKRYRKAFSAVEAEANAINQRAARVEAQQQEEALAATSTAFSSGRIPLQGAAVNYEVAGDIARRVELVSEEIPTRAEQIVDGAVESDNFDIGLGENVDPDAVFLDPETGQETTFLEAMSDLQEDRRLDEAMRTCLL